MAAICASNCEIGRPPARRALTISTKAGTAALSNGKMRPAKSSLNMALRAMSSAARRFPAGNSLAPSMISACVTALTPKLSAGWSANQAITTGAGADRSSSDTTLVSSSVLTDEASSSWARIQQLATAHQARAVHPWADGPQRQAERRPALQILPEFASPGPGFASQAPARWHAKSAVPPPPWINCGRQRASAAGS